MRFVRAFKARDSYRRHGRELKALVLAECAEPGASVARVALKHGLNANLVHKWRRRSRPGGPAASSEVPAEASAAQLEPRAAALADGIAQPFRVSDVSGTVGVNVGGALFPRDGRSEDDLLLAANLAMYRAKRSNRALWIEPGDGEAKP
jgi:transposase